jgi:polyphosphate kinase
MSQSYLHPRVKVHSKVLLVFVERKNKIKRYAYIGTGNSNAKLLKIY